MTFGERVRQKQWPCPKTKTTDVSITDHRMKICYVSGLLIVISKYYVITPFFKLFLLGILHPMCCYIISFFIFHASLMLFCRSTFFIFITKTYKIYKTSPSFIFVFSIYVHLKWFKLSVDQAQFIPPLQYGQHQYKQKTNKICQNNKLLNYSITIYI